MKILVEFVITLLYLNSVTPVVMYYIYDDAHKMGISGVSSGPAPPNFKYGFTGLQMKHFSRHPNAGDAQTVDLHFKVKKTSNARYTAPSEKLMIQESKGKPESQKRPSIDKKDTKLTVNTDRTPSGKDSTKFVYFKMPTRAAPHFEQKTQRSCRLKDGSFDSHSSLEVNVHKTQIPTVPQKVKLNSNRQLTAVSIYGPDNYHQKMPTSAVVDKTLQKKSSNADRDSHRVPHDMTAVAANGIQGARTTTTTIAKKNKRKIAYENMRKYIGKDNSVDVTRGLMNNENRFDKFINSQRRSSMETLKIVSMNDVKNIYNYTPYAIFYRTTPEIVDGSVAQASLPFKPTLETATAIHTTNSDEGAVFIEKRPASNYVDDSNALRKTYGLVKYGLHRNYREY